MRHSTDSSGLFFLLLFLLVYAIVLIGLCKLARAARRATTLTRRLIFALLTILISLVGFFSSIPFEMTSATSHLSINLCVLFILPLILGIIALFGARHDAAV